MIYKKGIWKRSFRLWIPICKNFDGCSRVWEIYNLCDAAGGTAEPGTSQGQILSYRFDSLQYEEIDSGAGPRHKYFSIPPHTKNKGSQDLLSRFLCRNRINPDRF